MKTQFHQSVVYGLLIAAVVAISGCAGGSKRTYWETELVEKYKPQINFQSGTVGGNCLGTIRLAKKISRRAYLKLSPSGPVGYTPRGASANLGDVVCGYANEWTLSHWGKAKLYLSFSLIQLDDDVFSITTKDEDRDNVDKYTLLVVAENGLHSGFKYARFETSESRDVTREVPLETTTTGRSSSYANTAYGTIYGFGSSNATTTTSGGYTKTDSYGRNHTVKYYNEKVEGAFNLAVMAKSIRRQDYDLDWEVVGLD